MILEINPTFKTNNIFRTLDYAVIINYIINTLTIVLIFGFFLFFIKMPRLLWPLTFLTYLSIGLTFKKYKNRPFN